jgi:hypothetical protein
MLLSSCLAPTWRAPGRFSVFFNRAVLVRDGSL